MPAVVLAFFILVGGGGLKALFDQDAPFYHGVDHTAKSSGLGPIKWSASNQYRAWSAPQWESDETNGSCKVTVFVLANGRGLTRVRIGGLEMLLDTSWIYAYTSKAGVTSRTKIEWLDPIGGAVVQERSIYHKCRHRFGSGGIAPASF